METKRENIVLIAVNMFSLSRLFNQCLVGVQHKKKTASCTCRESFTFSFAMETHTEMCEYYTWVCPLSIHTVVLYT